jgi:hypothetical protein
LFTGASFTALISTTDVRTALGVPSLADHRDDPLVVVGASLLLLYWMPRRIV